MPDQPSFASVEWIGLGLVTVLVITDVLQVCLPSCIDVVCVIAFCRIVECLEMELR